MAVVAPLSASYPVLTVTLSLLSGEPPKLRARRRNCLHHARRPARSRRRESAGPPTMPKPCGAAAKESAGRYASAVGFGLLVWLLGNRVIPRVGAPQTVWMIRMTCTVIAAAVILVSRQPIKLPRNTRAISLGMGLGDTTGVRV